jgi:hypothetical protein
MRVLSKLFVLCVALAAQSGWAGEIRTSLQVSATVVERASVTIRGVPAPVTITEADLARGYVDVERTFSLLSNSRQGVRLHLYPRVGLARQIDVHGLASVLHMHEMDVEVIQPASEALQLRFRLWLQPAAVPGEYPLPVHLTVVAI